MNVLSFVEASTASPRPNPIAAPAGDPESFRLSLADISWNPPSVEEARILLPQYEIECALGMSGMGAVYKGEHLAFNRPVTIKLLPMEATTEPGFASRFQREAQALSRLRHPGIVEIHDFGRTTEGLLYTATDYVDGVELRRLVEETGLSLEDTLRVIGEICEALHFAHGCGVVHGALKPENILLTRDGRVRLDDFGLSRPAGEEEGIQFAGLGSAFSAFDYLAPEQRDGRADPRADLFALGLIFHEMLTGRRSVGVFGRPSRQTPVDSRVDAVIRKALQERPETRYQSAEEMKRDLQQILALGNPASAVPKSRGFWRNPLGAGVTALVLLCGFALRHMAAQAGWAPPDGGLGSP